MARNNPSSTLRRSSSSSSVNSCADFSSVRPGSFRSFPTQEIVMTDYHRDTVDALLVRARMVQQLSAKNEANDKAKADLLHSLKADSIKSLVECIVWLRHLNKKMREVRDWYALKPEMEANVNSRLEFLQSMEATVQKLSEAVGLNRISKYSGDETPFQKDVISGESFGLLRRRI